MCRRGCTRLIFVRETASFAGVYVTARYHEGIQQRKKSISENKAVHSEMTSQYRLSERETANSRGSQRPLRDCVEDRCQSRLRREKRCLELNQLLA